MPSQVVEDEYVPPRRPPIPELWPWLLALLALVVGGLLAWYFLTRDNGHHKRKATPTVAVTRATVPRLVGLQEAAAVTKLNKAGLVPKPTFRTSRFAAGTVFAQNPPQGAKLARRSPVTLLVSAGTAAAAVPDVVGLRAADATARLRSDGFKVAVSKVASSRPPGIVLNENPSAGTKVPKGETVTIGVSKAAAKVAVPDVVGQPQSSATSTIRGAGLVPVVAQVSSTQPKGTVTAQAPVAGTSVAKGSSVRLNVSRGPPTTTPTPTTSTTTTTTPKPPAKVTVPNVVGQDQTTAQRRLERAGLRPSLTYVTSSQPAGQVVSQSPTAGATVQRGARVSLRISTGPSPKPLKTVPNVIGQDEGTAQATLRQAGFTVVVIDEPTTDPNQNGVVLDEEPAAGSRIPAGSQVTIYVGVSSTP